MVLYKLSPIHGIYCNIMRIFETVLSDSMLNQKLRSAKAGNETKIYKSYISTHCTVLAQLQLCNVAKYAFKSSIKIN